MGWSKRVSLPLPCWCTTCQLLLAPYWPPVLCNPPLRLWSLVNLLSVSPDLVPIYVPSFLLISMLCSDQCVSGLLIQLQNLDQQLLGSLSVQSIWLVQIWPPAWHWLPSPGLLPSEGPSVHSSSNPISWAAPSGLALIPTRAHCNVDGWSPVMLK